MYEETEESVARRQTAAQQRRLMAAAMPRFEGRPDKKARRAMVRAKRGGS
jgi:ribosome-associated heat shock protein Hsp15